MNFQKKIPKEVEELIEKLGIQYIDYLYYAWPQIFASTCGPRSGIGGQAISNFTVECFEFDGAKQLCICGGCYSLIEKGFRNFAYINKWTPFI